MAGKLKPGPPRKLSPELCARLCKLVSNGMFLAHAAAECGVSETTAHEWAKIGEDPDSPIEFRNLVYARARGEVLRLERLEVAAEGEGDWKAQAWILERLNPSRYKPPPERKEVTGADGGPVEIRDAAARVASRIARLAAAAGTGEGPGRDRGNAG